MKLKIRTLFSLLALLLLPLFHAMAAEGVFALQLTDDSKLWLDGDSSIHQFECRATVMQFDATVELQNDVKPTKLTPALLHGEGLDGAVASLVLTIPIETMKSGTPGLASQMHKTLKYKLQPNIVFTMQGYSMEGDTEKEEQFNILANGTLSLGGVTNTVEIPMTGHLKDNEIIVSGEKGLLMSDYGIKPPTLMFGRIKVVDEVIIKWELGIKAVEQKGGDEARHGDA